MSGGEGRHSVSSIYVQKHVVGNDCVAKIRFPIFTDGELELGNLH
jgi:hypothetical protein